MRFSRPFPRRRRARRPVPYWVLAGALAAVTGVVVAGLVERAASAAARYGDPRPTVVVRSPLPAGHVVEPGDVEVQPRPASFVPGGALRAPPVGRVLTAAVVEGEVLVADRVAPDGLGRVAALLPPGTRGVGVPRSPGTPDLEVGDVVDVIAAFDPAAAAGEDEPAFAVASSATVVDVGDDAVTVAVAGDEAARVAFALGQGLVTLALTAGPSRR